MQTRSHIITPPSQRRILINDFTSYSEAFEAATKDLMLCLPPRPSRASKEDTRPKNIFLCLPSRLSSLVKNQSFGDPICMYACECLRVLAYARAAVGAISSVALRILQAQPPTEGQLGFLGQDVSLRCLRPRLVQISRGNS